MPKINHSHLNGHTHRNPNPELVLTLGSVAEHLFDMCEDKKTLTLRFNLAKIVSHLSILLTVVIDKVTRSCDFALTCVGQNDHYLRVTSQERMKIICKWLFSQVFFNEFNVGINLLSGDIKIKIPILFKLNKEEPYKELSVFLNFIKKRFQHSTENLRKLLDLIGELAN